MTAYYMGDIPAEPLIVEPTVNGEPVDLSLFTGGVVTFRDNSNRTSPNPGFVVTLESDVVVIDWPTTTTTVFPYEGIYTITVTLTSTEAVTRVSLPPVYLVAQRIDGWHNLDSARAEWGGAPDDDRALYELLTVALEQVEAYAPAMVSSPPVRYKAAQLMQARNLWNSLNADPNGQFADGSFTIRPFPLDRVVKAMLRPQRVVGLVG